MDKGQRKIWNENHKKIRETLLNSENDNEAGQLFISVHSSLHSSSISHMSEATP